MSESLQDLLATETSLDRLGSRDLDDGDDLTLAFLAMLVTAIDETPIPADPLAPLRLQMSRTRKGGLAISATVALMLSSAGVATAVSHDPLAPLNYMSKYMSKHVWKLGPTGSGQLPGWDIEGSMPISTVPSGVVAGPGDHIPGGGPAGTATGGSGRHSAAGDTATHAGGNGGSGSATSGHPGWGHGSGQHGASPPRTAGGPGRHSGLPGLPSHSGDNPGDRGGYGASPGDQSANPSGGGHSSHRDGVNPGTHGTPGQHQHQRRHHRHHQHRQGPPPPYLPGWAGSAPSRG
jgi:hypothetical protein